MRIVKLTPESKNNILENLLKRSPNSYGKFEAAVNDILANVRDRKDEALFEYTKNFDKAEDVYKRQLLFCIIRHGMSIIICLTVI